MLRLVLFADLHLRAALDLSVLVGGNAPVRSGIRLGHLPDLHPGVLALVVDGDATTGGDLPPFALHPLHAGDGIASDLCDEGGGALCRTKDAAAYVLRRDLMGATVCLVHSKNIDFIVPNKQTPQINLLSVTEMFLGSSMKKRLSSLLTGAAAAGAAAAAAAFAPVSVRDPGSE